MSSSIVIKSVELINFMCHSRLYIEFVKPITCIGGRNGSGKSAIMIGIGFALGQRAQSLERGNSYKQLIKAGETSGMVKIKLNNTVGFRKDFFGDCIIVEKKLQPTSCSTYIKNIGGKIFSNKIEDLEYILDVFSISFTNPLNFLTQENAKKFLNVTKSEKLYEFFIKGTDIEDVKILHEQSEKDAILLRKKIEDVEEEVENINRELKGENEKMEILKNVENTENWIRFLEYEKELSQIDNSRRYNQLSGEIERIEESVKELNVRKKELTVKIEETILKEAEERERVLIEAQEKDKLISQKNKEIRKEEHTIKDLEGDIELFNNQIIEKKREVERKLLRMQNKDKNLENELEKLKEELNKNTEELPLLEKKIIELYKIKDSEEARMREIEEKKEIIEKQISLFNKTKKDKLYFFHDHMIDILREIQKTKFTDRVIGPIAHYVKLKEPKWFKAVSIVLRNILGNFIVFNNQDKNTLLNIFAKYWANFQVLMPSSKNLIEFERITNYTTMLDVLEIKNPIVINQLIILSNIDQLILIENRQVAYSEIRKNIKGIDSAYTIDGDRIKMYNGNLSDYRPRNVDRYYFQNTESRIEECEAELKRLSNIKFNFEQSELRECEYKKQNIGISIEKLKRRIESLEDVINDTHVSDKEDPEDQMEMLIQQKNDLEALVKESKEKITFSQKEVNRLEKIGYSQVFMESRSNSDFVERTFLLNKIVALEDTMAKKIEEQIEIESNEVVKRRELIGKLKKENWIENFCSFAKTLFKDENRRNSENIEEHTKKLDSKEFILKYKPRPIEEINLKITELQTKLDESKKLGKTLEIQIEIEELEKAKMEKQLLLDEYAKKTERILNYVKRRIEKRDELLIKVSEMASNIFKDATAKRNYLGTLTFDHAEENLHLTMKINKDGKGTKGTLSGGERSFAAICFLLSLWPSITCPIKILDEFDVFMDNANRDTTIQLLLNFFSERQEQVILITPLNVSNLDKNLCEIIVLEHTNKNLR